MQTSLATNGPSLIAKEWLRGAATRQAEVVFHRVAQTLVLAAEVRSSSGPGDAWHYERSIRLELRLSTAPRATIDGVETIWPLEGCDTDDDPAERVAGWILGELWNDELAAIDAGVVRTYGHEGWMQHPRYVDAKRRLRHLARMFRNRAIKLCDPSARALANTLSRTAQFFAYAALVGDPTGRIRQSIETCPGLWTLAATLSQDAAAEFLSAVHGGKKLPVLIERMLALTAAGHSKVASILLRRAPRLSPELLASVLRAPAIDINDIPRGLTERQAWYRTVGAWSTASRRVLNRDIVDRLGSYLSKHAMAYADDPDQAISELIDWTVRGGNRPPGRAASPSRVREVVDRWHEEVCYTEVDPNIELPRGPYARKHPPGLEVTQILTVGELLAETRAMHNCVVSLAEEARLGWLFIYRGVVNVARATIAIAPACDGTWLLHEAKGFANKRLDDRAHSIIDTWLGDLIPAPSDIETAGPS